MERYTVISEHTVTSIAMMGPRERYPWQEACAQAIRESHPVEVTGKQRYRAGVRVGQTEEEGRAFFCYSWHWCQELEGTDIDLGWLSHPTLTPTLIFYLSIIVPWWGLISKFHFPNCAFDVFSEALGEKKGLLINGVQKCQLPLAVEQHLSLGANEWRAGRWVAATQTQFLFAF